MAVQNYPRHEHWNLPNHLKTNDLHSASSDLSGQPKQPSREPTTWSSTMSRQKSLPVQHQLLSAIDENSISSAAVYASVRDREPSFEIVSHKISASSKATNAVTARRNATKPATTLSKKRKIHEAQSEEEILSSSKRNRSLPDTNDEEEEYAAISGKQKRSVAVPKAMGAKVSQIVEGLEKQSQQNTAGHQRPTIASNSKRVSFQKESNHLPNRSTVDDLRIPAQLQSSKTVSTRKRGLSPRVVINTNAVSKTRRPKTQLRSDKSPMRHTLDLAGNPRYWGCHCCGTSMIPYILRAHMVDKLMCANPGCLHTCCAKCVVGSVGELCEEKEWHSHAMGYWGWLQDVSKAAGNENV